MKNVRRVALGLLVLGVAACGETTVEPDLSATGTPLANGFSVGGNSASPDSTSTTDPTQVTTDDGGFSVGGN